MKANELFSVCSELWQEYTKFSSEFRQLHLSLEIFTLGNSPVFHIVAEWLDKQGKHKRLEGPSWDIRNIKDWEDVTHRLREVTEQMRRML